MKRIVKKEKINFKKIINYIGIILFITMLVLIYIVAPRITEVIQDGAEYLYKLDSTYITRVVELILSVSLVIAVVTTKKKGE